MTDPHERATDRSDTEWPLRPALLASFGAAAAFVVQQLILTGGASILHSTEPTPLREALAIGFATGAAAFGFALERVRALWTLVFAVAVGTVAGFVSWWSGGASHFWGDWHTASLFLAIAILVPLFQTARDAGEARFVYRAVHGHAWTNVVLWAACWAFTGIAFLLAWLLDALFGLIGIHVLRDLLAKDWFDALLFGAAFGGSLGLLRERDAVVRLLQRVVTSVLGVLAPVLGAGLLLFLGSLPFTGLHSLWEATRSTTPILLGCVIGALILANAVIGNGADEEARSPVLRAGAMALVVAVLPLALLAALATGLRIAQYGLTPDRLWAVVFVAFASAYGLAYLVALVRGRADWAAQARPANLRLAFAVAGAALFLATPLLGFNALSVADQVGRLEAGRTRPERFDWAALAFDFGEPGRAALKRLAASHDPAVAARARDATGKTSRWDVENGQRTARETDDLTKRLRVLPAGTPVPKALGELLTSFEACGTGPTEACFVVFLADRTEVVATQADCLTQIAAEPAPTPTPTPTRSVGAGIPVTAVPATGRPLCPVAHYRLTQGGWGLYLPAAPDAAERAALRIGLAASAVEVRTVPRRQVFVGGVPVGEPFE